MNKTNALLGGVVAVLILTIVLSAPSGSDQQAATGTASIQTYDSITGAQLQTQGDTQYNPGILAIQCSDGIDNDGDSRIDIDDAGCHTDGNINNYYSYNASDASELNTASPVSPSADGKVIQNTNIYDSGVSSTDGKVINNNTVPFLSVTPSYGMTNSSLAGNDIKKLQTVLRLAGVFNFLGPATGNFLGITLKAVKDFQLQNGLPATGVVDQATQTVLRSHAIQQFVNMLNPITKIPGKTGETEKLVCQTTTIECDADGNGGWASTACWDEDNPGAVLSSPAYHFSGDCSDA